MKLIPLTEKEATTVAGGDGTMAALLPIPLTDGRYIVSAAVLSDPAHAKHWPLLAKLPQCEPADVEKLLPATPWPPR